jgi:hypothetical protein
MHEVAEKNTFKRTLHTLAGVLRLFNNCENMWRLKLQVRNWCLRWNVSNRMEQIMEFAVELNKLVYPSVCVPVVAQRILVMSFERCGRQYPRSYFGTICKKFWHLRMWGHTSASGFYFLIGGQKMPVIWEHALRPLQLRSHAIVGQQSWQWIERHIRCCGMWMISICKYKEYGGLFVARRTTTTLGHQQWWR